MGICGEDSLLASFLAHASYTQLCGLFLACTGWCLCILATYTGQWRQWHIEKSTKHQSGVMWIGIWDICYDFATTDANYNDKACKTFGMEHIFFLPKEILVAQDVMLLGVTLTTLALGFFCIACWNITKDEKKRGTTYPFFTIGGVLSLISGTLVLIPVTWNMLSVLNNENIDFPESFDMPSHPKDQYVGNGIYLGFVSAALLVVTGLLFLGNKCLFVHNRIHPSDPEKGLENSSGKDSSLNVTTTGC